MNLFNLFAEIEQIDGDAADRMEHTRRKLLKNTFKAAAAAAPAFLATTVNKAFAQNNTVVDVLNFALTLEYLEDEFYRRAQLTNESLITPMMRPAIIQINKHEAQHVNLLRAALGSAAVRKPNFDFTAGGAFPTVFSDRAVFLTVAQALEDTGVAAYKGQAGNLMSNKAVLTVALQIHSVEARHAAGIRRMRNMMVYASESMTGGVPAAVYAGENNVVQGGADLSGFVGGLTPGKTRPAIETVRESFDEPLTRQAVLAIAGPFIRP